MSGYLILFLSTLKYGLTGNNVDPKKQSFQLLLLFLVVEEAINKSTNNTHLMLSFWLRNQANNVLKRGLWYIVYTVNFERE